MIAIEPSSIRSMSPLLHVPALHLSPSSPMILHQTNGVARHTAARVHRQVSISAPTRDATLAYLRFFTPCHLAFIMASLRAMVFGVNECDTTTSAKSICIQEHSAGEHDLRCSTCRWMHVEVWRAMRCGWSG